MKPSQNDPAEYWRVRIDLRGTVQGVGFRPFVYRLAHELGLGGTVGNTPQGVTITAVGTIPQLDEFEQRLLAEPPPAAEITGLEKTSLERTTELPLFAITQSEASGAKEAAIPADLATCADCLRELFDPHDRRHRYPFINCTNCGPRYSIIERIPYDRPGTTMHAFSMCDACRAEYEDPLDRRFHAQPNACPQCGPHLELWNQSGSVLCRFDTALRQAAAAISEGRIVAVKGLGGFHLIVDAANQDAVALLRERKVREEKPFAVMFPDLAAAEEQCIIEYQERKLLRSAASPIVLLRQREHAPRLAPAIAPRNPYLGVLLPYTPLHHLLLGELRRPVVATSGNRSDEPICIDEHEALERLRGIADLFLAHNRGIARHVDDSIVRVIDGAPCILRRARGYAPRPLRLRRPIPSALAVGAQMKSTVAVSCGSEVFVSAHGGDLDTPQSQEAFQRAISSLSALYDSRAEIVAADLHPDYYSTRTARAFGARVLGVQHHYAHVLSCMCEHQLDGAVLGVAWDGTGYGADGTIWGGEFLRVDDTGYERFAHLRAFALPGGEQAIREPWRATLSILTELFGNNAHWFLPPDINEEKQHLLQEILRAGVNCPATSSVGRLFDAVASLLNLRQQVSFEGQAAMELEFLLPPNPSEESYPIRFAAGILDWEPTIRALAADLTQKTAPPLIAARFHNALAEGIVLAARASGEKRVVLSGGCFQNRYLVERSAARLRAEGFQVFTHRFVPPNDGGIALGQISAVMREYGRICA